MQVTYAVYTFVSWVFLALHCKWQPYITKSENRLMTLRLWNCCILCTKRKLVRHCTKWKLVWTKVWSGLQLYGLLIWSNEQTKFVSIVVVSLNVFALIWFIQSATLKFCRVHTDSCCLFPQFRYRNLEHQGWTHLWLTMIDTSHKALLTSRFFQAYGRKMLNLTVRLLISLNLAPS